MKLEEKSTEIEELAELVAKEHWRANRVEPTAIASELGLTYSFGRYDDFFDGLLECKARRFHIYINLDRHQSADNPRARFSFAHELGHYFLDWHRWALESGAPSHGSETDFKSSVGIEREADQFAANLLLPREKLQAARARILDAREVVRLANTFGTSISSTAIRCARLDLTPMIAMKWTSGGRAWCWSSPHYERRTGNKAHKSIHKIPSDSITRKTLDSGSGTTEIRGTTLSTWFPFIRPGSDSDDILVEECISLGPYGALTILRPA